MNMRPLGTTDATHADLFGHLEHLMAQLDSPPTRRTARLMQSARSRKARKLVEEATEVAFDALSRNRDGLIAESVDLLYHLAVLWHDAGIGCHDIRAEMSRRNAVLGIAEKLPKTGPAKRTLKRRPVDRPCALYRQGDQIGPVPLSGAASQAAR